MNALAAHMLTVRLALTRFGWANIFACILCVNGITGWVSGIPHLHAQLRMLWQAISVARQPLQEAGKLTPAPAPRPLAEERLASFYDNLGEKRHAEQQVKTLFAVAGKTQLTLNQAEYKLAFDKNGQYYTYQIVLPVKGTYGAIRQFCEQTLLAIPFASLDEISFKRDAIGSRTLEAKLRFTLYLAGAASPAQMANVAKDEKS